MIGLGTGTPRPQILGAGLEYSNKSLQLDGVDELATAGNVTSYGAGDAFSVSFWMKAGSLAGGMIFGKMEPSGNFRGWSVNSNGSGAVRFQIIESAATKRKTVDTTASTFFGGDWHHVICTKGAGATIADLKIYVDGALEPLTTVVDIGTVGVITNTEDLTIGARGSSGTYNAHINIKIDEVMIFSKELSLAEVQAIYNAGCPKDETGTTGIAHWWRMGDASGDNWNIDTANEWTFIDQIGAFNMTTVNCEQLDVLSSAPCLTTWATKSLYLDGTNEIVNTDSLVASLAATTTGTWVAWIKPTDATPAATDRIITFGDTSANEFIHFSLLTGGELNARVADAGTTQWNLTTDSPVINQNDWMMVALIMDGVTAVMNVNGVEYSVAALNATMSISVDTSAWFSALTGIDNGRIGSLNVNGGGDANFFDGNVTDVQYYNTALSTANCLDIYNEGCPKDESARAGLVSYYRMGGGTGDNYNSGVANEWQFIDQVGTNDVFTDNCELDSVETLTPC